MSTEQKHRGRPVVAGSARQNKLAAQAAKIANGGTISKGRPANPDSKRQAKLAEKAARIAAGITVKVGRPKVEKVETVVEEAVEA